MNASDKVHKEISLRAYRVIFWRDQIHNETVIISFNYLAKFPMTQRAGFARETIYFDEGSHLENFTFFVYSPCPYHINRKIFVYNLNTGNA